MLNAYIEGLNEKKSCIIFDVDGVLADCTHRLSHIESSPPDWASFFAAAGADTPILSNLLLLTAFQRAYPADVILMTGRPESIRGTTEQWFSSLGRYVNYNRLLMRLNGDYRPDFEVKREMVQQLRRDGYSILMAIDDRPAVVDMFIEEGVPCLHARAPDAKKMELVKNYERKVTEYISGEGTAPGTYKTETEGSQEAEA